MKIYKSTPPLLFLLIFVSACSSADLSWNYDGSVTMSGKQLKTGLQSAYSGFSNGEGVFIAGYKIDNKGINHPYAVFVDNELTMRSSWKRNRKVQQFFLYKKHTYLLDDLGRVELYENSTWVESSIKLQSNSIIVDSNEFIIACKPTPLMKTSENIGSCYSVQKSWKVDLSWRVVKPKICDNFLVVVEDSNREIKAHRIDINSGDILRSISISTPVEHVCSLQFN